MQCINENSREYQTLKKQSGLSDFVLSAYVGDFLETHDRFPYLDELPEADSSKAISEDLSLNKDNTTKTENILQATNTNTVEEAVPVLNDKYRDKEIEVLEAGSKSKVYITTRPNTAQNQNGETDKQIKIATEMANIKERALANGTFMLAPNGRQTHLTEQQWLQVRTQEFKDWFGDWINDPENASKVVDENGEPRIVYRGINDSNNNKHFVYFSDSRVDAEAYAKGLFTKGGNFFANNKDIIASIYEYLYSKYNLKNIDLDYISNILDDSSHDGEIVPEWQYINRGSMPDAPWFEGMQISGIHPYNTRFTEEEIKQAEHDYDILTNNKEAKELLEIIYLINSTTFRTESDITRQYDDPDYYTDLKKLNSLLDKYNNIIEINKNKYKPNIQEVFLNIKNPYKEEIHSEDLLDNYKAYKNGHDGAFLLDGEHFLVKQGNQIKSATGDNGKFSSSNDNTNDNYENVNSFTFFNEIIDKLQTLYGINIIPITNAELSQDRWASITGTKGIKSFIYNGNIYINTDIATVDSPVHEFLHLLFGSMKYQNRALYDQLVGQAEQFDSYNTISQNYPNRTRGDINEEVFVTELAKYLTGQNNAISNLDQSIQNEIIYNVNRTLDTVLMGENSVKCVENPYIMNLKTLAKLVNSSTMISEKRGSLTDATLNRMMANTKSELIKNKELREECQ